jgi:hypothetical protein
LKQQTSREDDECGTMIENALRVDEWTQGFMKKYSLFQFDTWVEADSPKFKPISGNLGPILGTCYVYQ